ncbi:MAG: hypothetical protein IKZ58_01490 [Selenomonadaceae bacterium]|nr:hypothetical protein [Selenomonadaceae bacterium]
MKFKKIFLASFLTGAIFFGGFGCASEGADNSNVTPTKNIAESNNSAPSNESKIPRQDLIVYSSPEKYSYDDFMHDLKIIENNYSSQVQIIKLCDTPDGRGVYDIVLGDINGDNQVLIFGAMHAREYITTQVVMRQLCEAIDVLNGGGGTYRGISDAELLKGVTIHFVPLSNPDGVSISQFGLSGINNDSIRNQVASMGGDYVQWKANARGVDLNRNFDAGWYEFGGSSYPSSERYKGTAPGSEPEAAALISLTQDYHIKRAISYHTCGALIYWYYKQSGEVLAQSQKFANEISSATGYPLDDDYTAVDAAGYKDWAVYKLGIPSITIETGAESGFYDNPVPQRFFNGIWERNKNVVYATAYELKY